MLYARVAVGVIVNVAVSRSVGVADAVLVGDNVAVFEGSAIDISDAVAVNGITEPIIAVLVGITVAEAGTGEAVLLS